MHLTKQVFEAVTVEMVSPEMEAVVSEVSNRLSPSQAYFTS